MVWDAEAIRVAKNTIGTVESNNKYDVIYYADAITIGIAQWYGPRAAALLNKLKDLPGWDTIDASLRNDVDNHPPEFEKWNGSFWLTRYLTSSEGIELKAFLRTPGAVAIQDAEFNLLISEYVTALQRLGWNPNTQTPQFIYFMQLWHQSPKFSKEVLSSAGINASLARLHTTAMNHTRWYAKYRSRLVKALNVIQAWDDNTPSTAEPSPDGEDDGDADIEETTSAIIKNVIVVGDAIHVNVDGGTVICYPTGGNLYVPQRGYGKGPSIDPPDPVTPEVPPESDVTAKETALRNFIVARTRQYRYSQAAGLRDRPDQSGQTDCSGLTKYVYKQVLNVDIGANTILQELDSDSRVIWTNRNGPHYTAPPVSVMRVGDLVLYRWKPYYGTSTSKSASGYRVNHVEMYIGDNTVLGHGNPDRMGPYTKTHTDYAESAYAVVVKRVL